MVMSFNSHSPLQDFRLVQIETNCRRHFKVHLKWKTSTIKGRNTLWEKEKLLVISNFSFSHNVFHSYFPIASCYRMVLWQGENLSKAKYFNTGQTAQTMQADILVGCYFLQMYLTLSQTTNFRLFQTEEFADDNFEFDENGRKFTKQVENTVRKGEIARYDQFLLFVQCFQKTCTADK